MTSINVRMFGIMFGVGFKISTFINKPLFIHTSDKLLIHATAYAVVNLKNAHMKGQRSNYHIFKFQPNTLWTKKRPNRYTTFDSAPDPENRSQIACNSGRCGNWYFSLERTR